MESLQDQIDEVLLKSNWKIEESIEELSIDVTENIKKKKRVLIRNIQINTDQITDEALLSRITKMMQVLPLDGEKDVQA